MAKIDPLKEEIAYLKYWQGVFVLSDISLIAWLLGSSDKAAAGLFPLALAGMFALTFGVLVVHRRIERYILRLGDRTAWKP